MNKNQVKGVGRNVAGKVQELAGKLIGSKKQRIKGFQNRLWEERKRRPATSSNSLGI